MTSWKKNLLIVWLSQFLGLSGFYFTMPFIPYYMQHLGVTDTSQVALWVAVYTIAGYVSLAVVSPVWGLVADRYGRKAMLLRAHFCNAVIISLMSVAPSVSVLVLLRCLMGVFSGTSSASQTLVASLTPKDNRGLALGLLSASIFGGTLFGSFVGGIIVDAFGFPAAFLSCGVIFVISGMLVLVGVKEDFRRPQPVPRDKPRSRRSRFLGIDLRPVRLAWLLLILSLVMAMARRFDMPFLPLLVQDILGTTDKAATWTGTLSGFTAIAGVLAGPILGWLADKFSAPRVAVLSALLAALCMIPHGLATALPTLFAARFMMIFFAGGLDPVFQIWIAKSTPDRVRGVIFGWALTARSIGYIVAAALGGALAGFVGLRWVYVGSCLLFLSLIPIIRFAASRQRRDRSSEQSAAVRGAVPVS